MLKIIKPLSGRGKEIKYEYHNEDINVEWGSIQFKVEKDLMEDILKNFFVDRGKWYLLGACANSPIKDGLGEYIAKKLKLTPRHASAIAAIMYSEKMVIYRGKRPIELKKL